MLLLIKHVLTFAFFVMMQNNKAAQFNGHASNMLFMRHFTPTKNPLHLTDPVQINLNEEYPAGNLSLPGGDVFSYPPVANYKLGPLINEQQIKDKWNEYKKGMIQNPGIVTTGGIIGGVFGYGYMQAYLKGAKLGANHLQQNPKINTSWPKLSAFFKKAAQPNNPGNRGMMLYTIGHYCIIGAGFGIKKSEAIGRKWNNFLKWLKKKN